MIAPRFEDIANFQALRRAALRAARGHRYATGVAGFLANLEPEVLALERELLAGTWAPRPLRVFHIREPKPRTIAASAFRDRVVHHALCAQLEPRFEALADADSYACRVGKGTHAAVRRAQRLARAHPWFVKLDVRHFFETLPHDILLTRLQPLLSDARVADLVGIILAAGSPVPGRGVPIGNLTSQHFGNAYLSFLDQYARRTLRVSGLVRYMDDVLWFGPDKATVRSWACEADLWVRRKLGQELKAEATVVAPVSVGVPFLGFRIWPNLVRLDAARVRRLRRRLRTLQRLHAAAIIDADACQRRAGAVFSWAAQADTLRLRRAIVSGRRQG